MALEDEHVEVNDSNSSSSNNSDDDEIDDLYSELYDDLIRPRRMSICLRKLLLI